MTKQLDFESIRLRISRARASVAEYEVIRTETGYIATLYDGCWPYMENVKREDCQTCQGIGTTRSYKALAEAIAVIK